MPKVSLNDVTLRNLPVPEKGQRDVWDASFPAFGVRVSQGGSKTFVLNIFNSRRAIGRYPIISLAEARAEAKRLLAEKTLGKTRPQTISYREALTFFLEEKQRTRRPNTYKNLKHRLEYHFSFRGQLTEVSHQELARQLRKITSMTEQDHALSVAKTFFTWCHNRRYIEDNPTRGLSPHGHMSRARVLTNGELRLIWQATEEPSPFHSIVRLLLLTGQRRSEIAALQSSWIKEDEITLPAAITKNGREHTFPISSTASNILQGVSIKSGTCDLLFPARGTSTPFNGWSKSKSALDKASGVTGWTLHDLRRTFATIHASLGTPPHIIERLLNHVSGTISGVAAIYNRHHFLPEMREAAERYETHLETLVARQ